MKKIIWILFLLGSAVVCMAQPGYPVNLRNVIIGYQTTPEGLFFRGSHSPNHIPLEKYGTFMYVDTVTRQIWMYLDKDTVNGQPVGVWAKMYPSASDLSSLTDVNTTGKIQNSMLIYDAVTSKWIIDNGTVYRKTTDTLSGQVYGAYNNTKLDSVSALYFDLDTPPVTLGVGMLSWDATTGTASLGLLGGNVQLKVGQQLVKRVVNKTTNNVNLLKSEYKVVKLLGATGSRISVDLAQANSEAGSAGTLGVVIEDINNNQEGFILVAGEITNINTTGTLVGETWNEGDVLYLSATTPGALTKVKPAPPNHTVIVGWVESVNANNGKIYVKIDNGYELEELHNVLTTDKTNGSILYYDNGLWKASTGITLDNTGTLALNAVTANTLMYVDGNNKLRSVTLTTTGSSGAATFSNGTLNIPQYAGSTDLTFTGSSSPVTLNSSTGTDVTLTAGTNIAFSQAGNNLTINSTATSSNIYNSNGSIPAATTREVTVPDNSAVKFLETATKFTNIKGGSVLLQSSISNTLEANTSGLFRSSSTSNGNSSVQLSAGQVGLYGNTGENLVTPGLFVTADNKAGFTTSSTGTSDSVVVKTAITNELKSLTPQETRTLILPSQASNANKYLKTNGTDVSWETVTGGVTGTGAANKVAFWTDPTTLSNNNNFHWDNVNNKLGIGTVPVTNPPTLTDSTLTVAGGISLTGGVSSVTGVNVSNGLSSFLFLPQVSIPNERFPLGLTHTATSAGDSPGGIVGLALTAQTPNTNFTYGTQGSVGLNAMRIRGFHAASTTLAVLNGVNFTVRNLGSGTVTEAVGGNFVMGNAISGSSTGAGIITRGTGGSYSLENSSLGTINTLRGINVQCNNNGASNSIQNFYGFHLTALTGTSGSYGTVYGLYIPSSWSTLATNKYGIYTADEGAINYIAGNTYMGATYSAPQARLHVAGSFRVDGATTISNSPTAIASNSNQVLLRNTTTGEVSSLVGTVTDQVLKWDNSASRWYAGTDAGGGGAIGLTSLNGLSASSQTFAVGASPGISISSATSTHTFTLANQALAFHNLATNGIVVRTGTTTAGLGTAAVRTITGTSPITVTNGDGVSGNPTIALSTVPITSGGTGATTRQAALNALAGTTTNGQYLRGNGTNVTMSAIQAADIPAQITSNTTGTASNVTGIVAVANGGTGLNSVTGYLKGTGTAYTAVSTIPVADGGTGLGAVNSNGLVLFNNNTTASGTYTRQTPSVYTTSSTGTSLTWDLVHRSSGVYRISHASSTTISSVTVSNVVAGGIYAFHISGASNTVTITVQWPATFKDLTASTNYGTRVYTTPTIITCYYDGANFVCE